VIRRLAFLAVLLAAFLPAVAADDCSCLFNAVPHPCGKDSDCVIVAGLDGTLVARHASLAAAAPDGWSPGPDFYHRTGTKPPVSGDFLLGPTVNYTDKLGVGGTFGYQWHRVGVTLLGSVSAVQLKGENGTAEFRQACRTYHIPFSTGDRTQAEYAVNVLFTLRKAK